MFFLARTGDVLEFSILSTELLEGGGEMDLGGGYNGSLFAAFQY